jgi:hypothetical protein
MFDVMDGPMIILRRGEGHRCGYTRIRRPGNSRSDTEVGGSILGGIYLKPEVFLEAKIGLGDVPDWKIYVGWNR